MTPPEISSLQIYLLGSSPDLIVSHEMDAATVEAVKKRQAQLGLVADGIVGRRTTAVFMADGWLIAGHAQLVPLPAKPTGYAPLSQGEKEKKFGSPAVRGTSPLTIMPEFSKKIVAIKLDRWFPQAKSFAIPTVYLNSSVRKQYEALFDTIAKAGLGDRILSCAGSWVVRYVRGSNQTLSSHAFGTAIDFNAPQNGLGCEPAQKGHSGSLVEIVELLPQFKMWSGMWFTRMDGMHIESTATDEELKL